MAEEAVSKDAEQAVVGVEDESGAIWSGHLCVSSGNEIIKNGVGIVGGDGGYWRLVRAESAS